MTQAPQTRHFPKGTPQNLSPAALSIWAKTIYGPYSDPNDHRYLQLWQHMEDTSEIALHVWDDFVPLDVKDLLAGNIGSEDSARRLLQFIAAIHDVGKASPAFVVQNEGRADLVRQYLQINPRTHTDSERSLWRHELVGYFTIVDWMGEKGCPTAGASFAHGIASIVAGHHGSSITGDKKDLRTDHPHAATLFMGNKEWEQVRFGLLDWVSSTLDMQQLLDQLSHKPLGRATQILLTGLVIMADWMASNSDLCPLNDSHADETAFDAPTRARSAWKQLHMPPPWNVAPTELSPDDLFADRFALPGATLRPVQKQTAEIAASMTEPGLLIVEANMGEGKTEAALLAAEILAARFHCGGIYYALPSQATVNAMFTRILGWIGNLPANDQRTLASLFLAHGKNELNQDFEDLRRRWFTDTSSFSEAHNDQVISVFGDDTDDISAQKNSHRHGYAVEAVVNSWLAGRKRGNLSDFVVGTIDQVLMVGLKSKHVVLRHLALASKVVILDEIHSNTAYMNVYMETVLSWLGAYHVPVIMLSATLPQEKRYDFLRAYQEGSKAQAEVLDEGEDTIDETDLFLRPSRKRKKRRVTQALAAQQGAKELDLRYPLISYTKNSDEIETVAPPSSGRSTDLTVSYLEDDDETLVSLLRDELSDGGCAVVIRDTVSRAQKTFDVLREQLDIPVTMAHSRFLGFDRAEIDRSLLSKYRKSSTPEHRNSVVVATQVVEQSLDVDFDLMVTDVAPIDLILQRAGRLHRHHRGEGESLRPKKLHNAHLYITGISDWPGDEAPQLAQGLSKIYKKFHLYRSLEVLGLRPGKNVLINTPDDIPRLVQNAYISDLWESGAWLPAITKAKKKLDDSISNSINTAKMFRILNPYDDRTPFQLDDWLKNNSADPDTLGNPRSHAARASVRESNDSFEVLVLQRDSAGTITLPPWGDFDDVPPLPQDIGYPSREQVRAVLSTSISLGQSSLAYNDLDAVISVFEARCDTDFWGRMQEKTELSGQLLVMLDENGEAIYTVTNNSDKHPVTTKLHIRYTTTKGWEAWNE